MAAVPIHRQRRSLRIVTFLALAALATVQLRIALQEQAEYSGTGASTAMMNSLRSPFLLTWHGKRLHLLDGEVEQAEALYRRALVHNSLYIPAWLGLAELYNDRGRKAKAEVILHQVDGLMAEINRWRWDKALLTYQLGRTDVLAGDLSWIVAHIPGETRTNALKLAFSLWPDPAELLARLRGDNLPLLFGHAARTGKIETALAWWPEIEQVGVDNVRAEVLIFLNSLIDNGRLAQAAAIWRKHFNAESLFYNGDFTQEPSNTAFDWRISAPKGSTWRLETAGDGKGRALRLHFSGTENLGYHHLAQVVPLTPGRKYTLTAQVKSEGLTTDQHPYLEIAGFQCKMAAVRSEAVAESQPWTALTLPFEIPADCQAVQVRVRRDPSDRLDNLLGGDLWLQKLAIKKTGAINLAPVEVQ